MIKISERVKKMLISGETKTVETMPIGVSVPNIFAQIGAVAV